MLNPYTGAPLEADPIILIIDGSGVGISAVIAFIVATFIMISRDHLSSRDGAGK